MWYHEQPTPEGRKSYSKTQPVQFEEFSDCIAWWNKRIETKRAWRASGEQVLKYDADGKLLSVNLDVKNPNGNEDIEHLPPARLVENILAKERKILSILEGIRRLSEAYGVGGSVRGCSCELFRMLWVS
jgi:type I restriction enzyme M protein